MKYIIIIRNIEFMGDGKQTFFVESKTPKKAILTALADSLPTLSRKENFTGHIVEFETANMWTFSAKVGGDEDLYKVKKIHWFSVTTESGYTHKEIMSKFPLIKDTGKEIKSTFLKLKNYKKLKKLYKSGHKFLIVTGIDMRFENLIWSFWDVPFYTKELYKKGKRVFIIPLENYYVVTSQHPLEVENYPIEKFIRDFKDIKIFPVRFK